jgi:hypothetical protein
VVRAKKGGPSDPQRQGWRSHQEWGRLEYNDASPWAKMMVGADEGSDKVLATKLAGVGERGCNPRWRHHPVIQGQ